MPRLITHPKGESEGTYHTIHGLDYSNDFSWHTGEGSGLGCLVASVFLLPFVRAVLFTISHQSLDFKCEIKMRITGKGGDRVRGKKNHVQRD